MFKQVGEFASVLKCFADFIVSEKSWVPQVSHFFEHQGKDCDNFKLAAKILMVESKQDLIRELSILKVKLDKLMSLAESLPDDNFWSTSKPEASSLAQSLNSSKIKEKK